MDIEQQFNMVAEEYDANRRKFIPCYDDYYVNSTAFIASGISTPKSIIDLGAGTGLLSAHWYRHFPQADYLLVDIASDMLGVAERRFNGKNNVSFRVSDYTKELPDVPFDTVISALSIHHLEDAAKEQLFSEIYRRLPEDGIFVNYDQFCAGTPQLDEWYDRYWEGQLAASGLSQNDILLWQERRRFDRECSVEQECEMLRRCGFHTVKCIYSYQRFAVIIAL